MNAAPHSPDTNESPDAVWTVRRVLDWTRGYFERRALPSARLDAELLVGDALGVDRLQLFLRHEQPLTDEERAEIRARVLRRAAYEPVAYILGRRAFWTLDLAVDRRVLVPRPETERLVELALARLAAMGDGVEVGTPAGRGEPAGAPGPAGEYVVVFDDPHAEWAAAQAALDAVEREAREVAAEVAGDVEPEVVSEVVSEVASATDPQPPRGGTGPSLRVADVGTGSGCVALALAAERPDVQVYAVDRSADALAVAQSNVEALGLGAQVQLLHGDLLEPVPPGPLDLVVSNPPYIPSAEVDRLMPDVLEYEPRLALDGGPDGLAVIRRLIAQAGDRLRSGGALLLETGAGQGGAVAALCAAEGRFTGIAVHPDLAGHDRVVEAVRR